MRGREREVKREGWGRREEKGDTLCNCPDHLFV